MVKKKQSWADKLGDWRSKHRETYAKAILGEPEKSTILKVIKRPSVVVILGNRRMGKSVVAHEVAHKFHNRYNMSAVLHLPGVPDDIRKRVQKRLPQWMRVVTNRREWPANCVVIYDEAAQSAHARRSQSSDAVDLENLIGISGQRNQVIVFVSHHSAKLDINVLRGCQTLIWKAPTMAHAAFERDEHSDYTYKALEFFNSIKGEMAKKRATIALDYENLRFYQFRNSTPPWWSDELSRIFQDIKALGGKR